MDRVRARAIRYGGRSTCTTWRTKCIRTATRGTPGRRRSRVGAIRGGGSAKRWLARGRRLASNRLLIDRLWHLAKLDSNSWARLLLRADAGSYRADRIGLPPRASVILIPSGEAIDW